MSEKQDLNEPETLSSSENEAEIHAPEAVSDEDLKRQMSRYTRRSFLVAGISAIGAAAGWEWLKTRPEIGGAPESFRKVLEFNESVAQTFYSPQRLAPTFPLEQAQMPRVNGHYGVDEDDDFNPAMWKLQIVGVFEPKKYHQYVDDIAYETEETDDSEEETDDTEDAEDSEETDETEDETAEPEAEETPEPAIPGLLLTLADIKSLPRYEMVTELKCIEGWSAKVYWAGARLADFIEKFAPATRDGSVPDIAGQPQKLVRYVSLQTPDEGYYVGLDMPSAMHPQTLLCYEMNGAPLPLDHGAPLRLVTPLKYGIKHIKRIGRITFTDERPKDFWGERGYDWYSGH